MMTTPRPRLVPFWLPLTLAVAGLLSFAGCSGCDDTTETTNTGGTNPGGSGGGGTGGVGATGGGGVGGGGQGGEGGAEPEVVVETCTGAPTASPGDDICAVNVGDGRMLIVGDILQPGHVYEQGGVLLDAAGLITCAGCDCFTEAAGATEVICPDAVVSPGLINAHDHVGWMNGSPWVASEHSVDPMLRWEHRHDWRCGDNGNPEINVDGGGASVDEKTFGELRFVLSGATAIFGSGDLGGLLRDLDDTGDGENGLNQPGAKYDTFVLGDSDCTTATGSCTAYDVPNPASASYDCHAPHVAEGISATARNELLCLTGQGTGSANVLDGRSAIIHGVGVNAQDVALMAQTGIDLIWSPRTNVSLYGDTAPVTLYDRLGVTIGMGTDWLPSGSMNMLRELACADSLNQSHFGGYFSDHKLWKMATVGSARALAFDDVTGVLTPGHAGDIAIYANAGHEHYRSVIAAGVEDVALVLRGGKVLSGNDAVVTALETDCDALEVCSVAKRVCLTRDTGKTLAQLQSAVGAQYPLFFCATPDDEPSCFPARTMNADSVNGSGLYSGESNADDLDGDGVANDDDDCPTVFNPVRPMDEGAQADVDDDGVGDACDPCPLDANTTECTPVDPDDMDGDGIDNVDDNCPNDANPNQEDADDDDKGDACDECPNDPNPGTALCPGVPLEIYDIQDVTSTGHPAEDSRVQVSCIITAVGKSGVWCQEPAGGAYSGIAVHFGSTPLYADTSAPQVGDEAVIDGTYIEYWDLSELTQPTMTFVQVGTEPVAELVTADEVADGGANAEAYEGVLIEVQGVQVTVDNGDAPDDYDAFVVTDGLWVDDTVVDGGGTGGELDNTFPVGTSFASLVGPLTYSFNHFRILPRTAADVVQGAPFVSYFAPDEVYVEAGGSAVLPSALTIHLSGAAQGDTVIDVSSSNGAVLTVPTTVTVLDGNDTVVVPLTGNVAQLATVTVTASHTVSSVLHEIQATVHVYDDSLTRSVLSVTPDPASVLIDTSTEFTVTLDLPAPTGGSTVALGTTGGIGTVPANVSVAADAFSATFLLDSASTAATGTITATLNGTASADVTVLDQPMGSLVINEVDYDQPSTDTMEFIEIYNGSTGAVSLAGHALILVTGSDSTIYDTIDLSSVGSLPAGGFLVVHGGNVAPAGGALELEVSGFAVQNGDPDGMALVSATSLVDAMCYEGTSPEMTSVDLGAPWGVVSFVSGTYIAQADTGSGTQSLARLVDGVDTGDDGVDWGRTTTLTPGAANVITP